MYLGFCVCVCARMHTCPKSLQSEHTLSILPSIYKKDSNFSSIMVYILYTVLFLNIWIILLKLIIKQCLGNTEYMNEIA